MNFFMWFYMYVKINLFDYGFFFVIINNKNFMVCNYFCYVKYFFFFLKFKILIIEDLYNFVG